MRSVYLSSWAERMFQRVLFCIIKFISEANTMFYCVSLTIRMQKKKKRERERAKKKRSGNGEWKWTFFGVYNTKYVRISSELERVMNQMCVCLWFLNRFLHASAAIHRLNKGESRAKKKSWTQTKFINIFCLQGIRRTGFIVCQSRNRLGIAYIREKLSSNEGRAMEEGREKKRESE